MTPKISYHGVGEALFGGRDVLAPEIFAVTGDGYDIRFLATASGTLGKILEDRGVQPGDVVRTAGLIQLERRLASDELPQRVDEGYEEVLFASDNYDELVGLESAGKECAWQIRDGRGLECDATPAGQERATTEAVCHACALPDERLICAHLRHPTNLPIRTFGGFERLAGPALCEIGNDPENGSGCRPGGKECWQRLVAPSPHADEAEVAPPAGVDHDLLREAAAAIDHFSSAYLRRYGVVVWNIAHARTIAELGGQARTEESFQRKVQVLALLLDGLRPHGQLDEAQRVDGAGRRVGGLVALERLLERDAANAVEAARMLRYIRTLRNGFPAHVRARGFDEAVAALGLVYPPTDWNATWQTVLRRFRDSLNEIRAAL